MVKRRFVFKKGRFILTRKPGFVLKLANELYNSIKPLCKKIEIVGSIRRQDPKPVDIDIVLIPKSSKEKQKILNYIAKQGKFIQGGEKRSTFKVKGVKVEIYYAKPENWGAMLLSYTGPSGSSIGLRIVARKKGMLLNQYGLFDRTSKKLIAGKTEKDIYNVLGKKWKKPSER
ncbi:MAG: hypothetical protein ACE5ES_03385 [Candidatus Nanoarchaeia archaeon]